MDDFSVERPELNGSLITLEFGTGGRIYELWASDPSLPEEGEEFQFTLSPISFGEEFAEDYYPGTILLGARTGPGEPWILDRNRHAEPLEADEQGSAVLFDYEFPLLTDLRVTGRFFELPGPIPQILWDVTIRNRSRVSVEIGELAFPLALNNLYEGFRGPDSEGKGLLHDRVRIHRFIGGAASYLHAVRMSAEPPGLLIFPGEETEWEFCASVSGSLATPYRWAGIPIVYIFSQAAFEREDWSGEFSGHRSLILEPGDQRTFQTRFVPTSENGTDVVFQTLTACGSPAIRLLPAAVSPAEVGIAIEVAGATPTRFYASSETELETDADEEGGFCYVKPPEAGPLELAFEDTQGRVSRVSLLFTEPIENLMRRRAEFIVEHQVCLETGTALEGAVVPVDLRSGEQIASPEAFMGPFGVDSGLADTLYLAEKNTVEPVRSQIAFLEKTIRTYIRDDLQNPGDASVGSAFADFKSVALNYGRPEPYLAVSGIYHAMSRIAATYGETTWDAKTYLAEAGRTAIALFRNALVPGYSGPHLIGIAGLYALQHDLVAAGFLELATPLDSHLKRRAEEVRRRSPEQTIEWGWDPGAYEEAYFAHRAAGDAERAAEVLRRAFACRSLGPNYATYGSDPRIHFDPDGQLHPILIDKGEMYMGSTAPTNSLLFFATADRDYRSLPDVPMRLAFGGMLAPWGLVRPDGAATMGVVPDAASKMGGVSITTGDIGMALATYLRGAAATVLPSRNYGVFTFGCHFEMLDEGYLVRPWDGVGRRVVMRQIDCAFELDFGKIRTVQVDSRKRRAVLTVENPSDKDVVATMQAHGLWGTKFQIGRRTAEAAADGVLRVPLALDKGAVTTFVVKVVS